MQFTGLKDKNGKEIYDGDILLIDNESVAENIGGYDRCETDNLIEEVKWKNGAWFTGDEMLYEACSVSEVIGNIYENAELPEINI